MLGETSIICIGNDALDDLYKSLEKSEMSEDVQSIKKFLDSSKTLGGAGCTPAAHHGGQYSGTDIALVFKIFENIFNLVPGEFGEKEQFKIFFHTCSLIFSTLGVARFVTEKEIELLEKNVLNLSELIFLKFKKRNITPKMHDILGIMPMCHLYFLSQPEILYCIFFLVILYLEVN